MSDKKLSIMERMKKEPLIPVGVLATVSALVYATWGVTKRNHTASQNGMRGRVIFQGLTIAAIVYYSLRNSNAVEDKSENARPRDVRPIDWDKLEREAAEAEKREASGTGTRRDPAIERLAAFAKEKKKGKSIFSDDTEGPNSQK
ncbi:Respiratory supercomplex factor 1, mitochondrial [Coemansia guatemalensis]|uniref:Respiratory supercomplex factor 1, mitochondrial n=1 Tax=Coemansia guatemalensis TaxID=2761395 RepID=A0A9W8LSA2_9FUNG|nr:Respiratory supercomplex factor 1, mitochondrial [Coemansia guatemalensis]